MSAPSGTPTLADLQARLADAKRDRLCAEMIDNTTRMEREVAEADRRVAAIKAQIAVHDSSDAVDGWYFGADRSATRGIA